MREFTFYLTEENGYEVELWNHYGCITEKYIAGKTFVNVDEMINYIFRTLTHYKYNTVFFMKFRNKRYTCHSRMTVSNILSECGVTN